VLGMKNESEIKENVSSPIAHKILEKKKEIISALEGEEKENE
jgi:hypothetical protein